MSDVWTKIQAVAASLAKLRHEHTTGAGMPHDQAETGYQANPNTGIQLSPIEQNLRFSGAFPYLFAFFCHRL